MDTPSERPVTTQDPFDALLARAVHLAPVPVAQGSQLRPGTELCAGRFRIERRLGAGGMGLVYEAQDRVRGVHVALKTLSQLDAHGIARLKAEFRQLADVVHPNLVRLHELHAERGLYFFAMELVHGTAFDRWVRPNGAADPARLRTALGQLVAGVRAIHAAGKLHGDLKPDNVLVRDDGRLVILDFGLVTDRLDAPNAEPASDGKVLGTPAYMAPEQAVSARWTAATDLYQLGVMLFEGLTGRFPFEGEVHSLLHQKRVSRAPSAASIEPSTARDLAELCERLLERDPLQRPSGDELERRFVAPPERVASLDIASHASVGVGAAALIGRDAELAQLHDALRDARAGTTTVVRVVGESGIGKSSLVRAFMAELRGADEVLMLGGRCYERERLPYNGFDRLVDALTEHMRTMPDAQVVRCLPPDARALARLFPVLERVEALARLSALPELDDRELRRRAWDALRSLLKALRAERPLLLVIDDVQWMDEDSAQLLEYLLDPHAGPALLWLLCERKESQGHSRLARLGSTIVVPLAPLPTEASARMATTLLGDRRSLAPLADTIAQEAAGNPFLIAELVRANRPGMDAHGHVEVSLRGVVDLRMRALSAGARRLAEAVALSGRPVPSHVVLRTVDGVDDPHGELDRMCSLQLLDRARDGWLECHHDRIRVALDASLTDVERRTVHARLARAWADSDYADPEVLFEHYHAAAERAQAAVAALAAAEKATGALAFERGAAFYRHAIELSDAADAARLELHQRLGAVLSLAGRWREAGFAFSEASLRASESSARALLQQHAARHLLASGASREGIALLRRSFEGLRIRWPRSEAGALLRAGMSLAWLWLTGARYTPREIAPPSRLDGLGYTLQGPWDEAVRSDARTRLVVAGLLDGAALVPPYDLPRGLYFATEFARRALSWGERSCAGVALGLLATLFAASRLTRGFALRLAARAEHLARTGAQPDLAAAALGFAGFARLLDGQLRVAAELGAQGAALLQDRGRAHAYQRWGAQSLESCARLMLGDLREATRISDSIGREARALGDELALVGGEAVACRLLVDDVAAAEELLKFKEAWIQGASAGGVLQQLVVIERVSLALYTGRGGEALAAIPRGAPVGVAPFSAHALAASCALQALAQRDARSAARTQQLVRRVRRARGALVRGGGVLNRRFIAQIDATLHLLRGERATGLAALEQVEAAYRQAGLALHADVLAWRRGHLLGGPSGAALVRESEARIVERGVVRPAAWAELLAAGLGPPPA